VARPTFSRSGRLALGAAALVAVLGGCSFQPTTEVPVDRALLHTSTSPVGFVAVGDSITAWTNSANPSWIASATSSRVIFEGGWAVPGATTTDMLAGLSVVPQSDVLVIMAGTNDFLPEFDDWAIEESMARLLQIADEVTADRVVLSAIAPNDFRAASTQTFNRSLRELANREGWLWVDPWPAARASDGSYLAGSSQDGIHPTQEVEAQVGIQLRSAVLLAGLARERGGGQLEPSK
jgi:acyl-CoA thioesterase-1